MPLAAWLLAFFLSHPPIAACDSAGAARVEHEWLGGEQNGPTLERVLAPDFVHAIGTGQFISKADHIAYATTHPPAPGTSRRFDRLDVRLVGGVAIATGIVAAGDSTLTRIDHRTVFTDIFACRDGRWQAVGAQETPVR